MRDQTFCSFGSRCEHIHLKYSQLVKLGMSGTTCGLEKQLSYVEERGQNVSLEVFSKKRLGKRSRDQTEGSAGGLGSQGSQACLAWDSCTVRSVTRGAGGANGFEGGLGSSVRRSFPPSRVS